MSNASRWRQIKHTFSLVKTSPAASKFRKRLSIRAIWLVMVAAMILVSNLLIGQQLTRNYPINVAGKLQLTVGYSTVYKQKKLGFHYNDAFKLQKLLGGLAEDVKQSNSITQKVRGTLGQTVVKFYLVKLTEAKNLSIVSGNNLSDLTLSTGQHNVVISTKLAQKVFGKAKAAVGQALSYNGRSYKVVGVAKAKTSRVWIAKKAVMTTTSSEVSNKLIITLNSAKDAAKVKKKVLQWLKKHGSDRTLGTYSIKLPTHHAIVISQVLLLMNRLNWWLLLGLMILIVTEFVRKTTPLLRATKHSSRKHFFIWYFQTIWVSFVVAWINVLLGWILASVISNVLLDVSFEQFFTGSQMLSAIIVGVASWGVALVVIWWRQTIGRPLQRHPKH